MNAPERSIVFQDIAAAIGRESARKLVEAFGGTRISVPAKLDGSHDIAKAIGLEAARNLSHFYHGTLLSLPVSAARRQEVEQLDAQGLTRQKIALRTGYSERQVYRILSEEADDRQSDLFSNEDHT